MILDSLAETYKGERLAELKEAHRKVYLNSRDFLQLKLERELSDLSFPFSCPSVPQQDNNFDCGVHTLMCVDRLVFNPSEKPRSDW